MQKQPPPLRIICPERFTGATIRTPHTPAFQQIEGLAVDEGLTFRDFKGLLNTS
jgi:phenylalanyl-tRNA synthetase alpha chain